ncbi:hypothetical protein [Pseudoalteromonas sp. P1-25]|uniref:hypothetical protein n=2 Tax=unclassified Pseudoalteromonas TaxID=194690 RepID=UPI0006D66638|nr:hypothetical protein [Pseudoalteromonas sp. P1-25]KPZ58219.1 hypothetical protein AN393_00027 [Pseudoalteromonas sp. P1-25]
MAIQPIKFSKSCIKTLTAVEADEARSHQHEFQGVAPLKEMFGYAKLTTKATFSIRGSSDSYSADLTWYDAREGNPNRSAEYRLYFQSSPVMEAAQEGDVIVIGYDKNNNIHCELIQSQRLTNQNTQWQISQNTVHY